MEPAVDIKWDKSLSVGVDEIDSDHKELINLFNQLYASCSASEGALAAAEMDTLLRLLDYTKHHFKREEKLMKQEGYPDYEEHRELHDDLLLITLNFQEQLQSSEIHEITDETLEFLRSWIVNHIMECDKAFGSYLTQKHAACECV
ncbi:MAG: bacteriohemerythrin [Sulfuricellaceae bacterium]